MVTDEKREKTNEVFDYIIANKDLEIPKESIIRVNWKDTGFLTGGHFLFNTTSGDVEIRIISSNVTTNTFVAENIIRLALVQLVPDRFYNEKTGLLQRDEVLTDMKKHPDRYKYFQIGPS